MTGRLLVRVVVSAWLAVGLATARAATASSGLATLHRALMIASPEAAAPPSEAGAATPDAGTVPAPAAPAPEIPAGYRSVTYGGLTWAMEEAASLELAAADFVGAEVEYGIVKVRLALGLTETAAAGVTKLTEAQVGKALALCAGGAVVSVATVPRPVRTTSIQTMAFRSDAQPLLDSLRASGVPLREIDRYADVKEPLLREAVGCLERGETQAAAQAYERLLAEIGEDDARTAGFRLMLAGLYQQLGELPKAKELLDQVVVGPITRENRTAVLQAFQVIVDMMEGLRNVPLRNEYLTVALRRLSEVSEQQADDKEFNAWCALSAGMLHVRYMELERVPKILEETDAQAMPGGWHLLKARYHEVMQDRDSALTEYRWIEANAPDLAELARVAREELEAGGWTYTRSPVSAMIDQMIREGALETPAPGSGEAASPEGAGEPTQPAGGVDESATPAAGTP